MADPVPDSALSLSLLTAARGQQREASQLENEVIGLFDQHRSSLLRYVLSFGLPIHDAEEVVQEVFLALFQHLQQGRRDSNVRGWLFRVAHNLALKQRTSTRHRVDELDPHRHVDPDTNPEQRLLALQRGERLQAVLHALPEQDQWCLRLRAEGLRYREIAATLGISLGGVAMSLTRSLARLGRADEL